MNLQMPQNGKNWLRFAVQAAVVLVTVIAMFVTLRGEVGYIREEQGRMQAEIASKADKRTVIQMQQAILRELDDIKQALRERHP